METRLTAFSLSAGLWLLTCAAAPAGEDGRALLAEVMDKPGYWIQMCSSPAPLPFDVPLRVFSGSLVERHFILSPAQTRHAQTARAQIIPALQQVLAAMDLTKPPEKPRGAQRHEFENARTGFKPEWLNPMHLQIIDQLHAVETLPELLRLEAQLSTLLESAQKDPNAPLPALDIDSASGFVKPGEKDEKRPAKWWENPDYKRDHATFSARVMQRELLGTITLLLQREEWPALKERFAAEHKAAREKALIEPRKELEEAKARVARREREEKKEKLTAAWKENVRQYLQRLENEVTKLESVATPIPFRTACTPAIRAEIRTMAETFLKTIPPEKRRAAAAMPKPDDSE